MSAIHGEWLNNRKGEGKPVKKKEREIERYGEIGGGERKMARNKL